MTFTRTKIIDNKPYRYRVRNDRVRGKVKQKVVKYIGPVNPIYKVKKKRKSNAWLFVRELTEAEIKTFQKSVKSSIGFTRDRARIILLSSQKNSCNQIAEKLSCDVRKVRRAISAFNKMGLKSLERKKAKGAKPKFTKEQRAKMLEAVLTNPVKLGQYFTTWSLPKLQKYFIEQKIVDYISIESIRQIMRAEGTKIKKSKRFQYSDDPEFAKKNF